MKKAIEIKAPNEFSYKEGYISVFLAGSIDENSAEEWQKKVVSSLKNKNIMFLNPRRDNWDNTWEQKITNPEFKLQVTWELTGLEFSDIIVLYFDPKSKSPISLLELGIHAKSRKIILCCPDGFYRKGNIDIVCERYGIRQVKSFDDLIVVLDKLTQ